MHESVNDNSVTFIAVRAQFLREAYARLLNILTMYNEGNLAISESIDEMYVRLLQLTKDIVNSPGFEELGKGLPSVLPNSLHSLERNSTGTLQNLLATARVYTGSIIQFCVDVGANHDESLTKLYFKDIDRVIESTHFANSYHGKYDDPRNLNQELFSSEIVQGTRGYIIEIARQANGCYRMGWYDASAVMLRRLIETLLIECFERHSLVEKIKRQDGNFLTLEEIINKFANEAWNLGRDARKSLNNLTKLKSIGDLSAHNRRFLAKKGDLEKNGEELRILIQELITIAFDPVA